jgi:RNA polymerase sigma-70 factor (ECF subfamily)
VRSAYPAHYPAGVDSAGDLERLLARAQGGDVRAFEALVDGHLAQVRRFARAFTPNRSDADDLAQDALVKVYRNLRLFRYQASFSTWLYTVVRNTLVDSTRSRAGRARAREVALEPAQLQDAGGGARPDEQLAAEEERRRVWRALRHLPLEFRTAVVLFDLEGHSYDEVAAIEGVPVGTVKSRLARGREQLRRLLSEGEPAPERATEVASAGTETGRSPSNLHRSGS